MKFFITGISGFVGTYLARHLLETGHEVRGIARDPGGAALDELRARFHDRFPADAVSDGDVRDGERLRGCLREARPDGVFHLAGIAFPPRANREPRATYEVNFLGTVELLGAVRDVARGARVVVPSSAEIYGRVEAHELPIVETQPLRPASAYGVSKAAADLAAFQAHAAEELDVVRARPFNHTGPGQSPDFVCSDFARAVALAEKGTTPAVVRVGNVDVERDFSDVRDTVRAYVALFEKGAPGEAYNVGAGRSVAVRQVLERLIAASRVPLRVETDPAKVRPRDVPRLEVSIRKIQAATGWQPHIPLDDTLYDLLSWWREEVQR